MRRHLIFAAARCGASRADDKVIHIAKRIIEQNSDCRFFASAKGIASQQHASAANLGIAVAL